jgi:hypothetical protein
MRFLTLIQCFRRPPRYGRSRCFETRPSSPNSQALRNRSGPISPCSKSLKKMPSGRRSRCRLELSHRWPLRSRFQAHTHLQQQVIISQAPGRITTVRTTTTEAARTIEAGWLAVLTTEPPPVTPSPLRAMAGITTVGTTTGTTATVAARTIEAGWSAARTPVPTGPKSKRRVSAVFVRSSTS